MKIVIRNQFMKTNLLRGSVPRNIKKLESPVAQLQASGIVSLHTSLLPRRLATEDRRMRMTNFSWFIIIMQMTTYTWHVTDRPWFPRQYIYSRDKSPWRAFTYLHVCQPAEWGSVRCLFSCRNRPPLPPHCRSPSEKRSKQGQLEETSRANAPPSHWGHGT